MIDVCTFNGLCFFIFSGFAQPFHITMTSLWAWWRLKSPASRLFTQPFILGADQRKHQSSASLAFVRGIHRWPVHSPHKGPVTRKMFPFDDVMHQAYFVGIKATIRLAWHGPNAYGTTQKNMGQKLISMHQELQYDQNIKAFQANLLCSLL